MLLVGGVFLLLFSSNMAELTATYTTNGPVAQRIASSIPYFPFKGIDRFYDIGGMLAHPEIFQLAIDSYVDKYKDIDITSIAGFDARGFILGPPIALALKKPFIMLRKAGKMPNAITGSEYKKEYEGDNAAGGDTLGIQRGAVKPGDRVLLVDDLVATGGTLLAGIELVKQLGGSVVECACMVELRALGAANRIAEQHPEIAVWGLISEQILTRDGEAELQADAAAADAAAGQGEPTQEL